jgi:UDP-N-acetylglucosamine--N-acetylmuramyl-(pentapeptide) pyrophosphoryl-undecaprenol N-acetylglucosamine transferase
VVQELGVGGVLGMGGFMSAGPLVAGRWAGRATVLHEANAVPGRANRWLSHGVHEACVNFADTALALSQAAVEVVGMPVRARFEPMEAAACRLALGLDGRRPVLLVAGGSQGARGLNAAVRRCAPALLAAEPELQLLHLTGAEDFETTRRAYAAAGGRAVVRPFLTEMELALGAATLAVSRAGASTLAELAAMRVPALLIPFPAAVDDHQYYNARAFVRDGAARVLRQDEATPERLTSLIRELLGDEGARQAIRVALGRWHRPDAAMRLARAVLRRMPGEEGAPAVGRRAEPVGTAGAGRRV